MKTTLAALFALACTATATEISFGSGMFPEEPSSSISLAGIPGWDGVSITLSTSSTDILLTGGRDYLKAEDGSELTLTLNALTAGAAYDITLDAGNNTVLTQMGVIAENGTIVFSDSFTSISKLTITPSSTPAVPEPTTATLSLLALTGLAARRRRH